MSANCVALSSSIEREGYGYIPGSGATRSFLVGSVICDEVIVSVEVAMIFVYVVVTAIVSWSLLLLIDGCVECFFVRPRPDLFLSI